MDLLGGFIDIKCEKSSSAIRIEDQAHSHVANDQVPIIVNFMILYVHAIRFVTIFWIAFDRVFIVGH